MQAATEFRIPVVPRGAGTGLAGGANGTDGAIVLSVAGMDRILEISPEDELAVVEPGVINADLNAALRPHGLWFAPDPASKAISSVGGNIATNAGGLLCAKYGVTREAVLGLSVVLPDGRLIRTGHRTVKGVTGFDLTALFVGSEGTLGVIVDATVRVLPLPVGGVTTIGALFPDVGQRGSRIRPRHRIPPPPRRHGAARRSLPRKHRVASGHRDHRSGDGSVRGSRLPSGAVRRAGVGDGCGCRIRADPRIGWHRAGVDRRGRGRTAAGHPSRVPLRLSKRTGTC